MSRFKCLSFRTITWSSKSRRQLPTQRSATPFCQGLRKAVRPASHLSRGRHHVIAKLRVTVEQQKSMGRSIGPSFPHLLHDPECVRISREVEAKYLAPIMPDDEEAVKNAKRKRWHGEEVHGCDRVAVIPQERQPTLAWISSSPNSSKPSRDGRFRD